MHSRTWKKREGQAAALFGAKRKPLSGSGGRADETRSDSKHATVFLEVKSRKKPHAVRTLWSATKLLADKEQKIPVLALASIGYPGFLMVCHSDDLVAFAREILAAAETPPT